MHLPTGLWLLQSILAERAGQLALGSTDAKAATLTAVVPTSRPMMTSVVRFVISLGRYCIRLTQDGVDELFVAPETGLENV